MSTGRSWLLVCIRNRRRPRGRRIHVNLLFGAHSRHGQREDSMFGHGSELGFTIRALSPSDYSLSRNGDLEWVRSSPRFHRGGDCGDTIGSVGPSMEGGGGGAVRKYFRGDSGSDDRFAITGRSRSLNSRATWAPTYKLVCQGCVA